MMSIARNHRIENVLRGISLGLLVVAFIGCSSTIKSQRKGSVASPESRADVETAVSAVVGSVSGQDLKSEDLRKLGRQIATDKETQSAVGVLQKSLSGDDAGIKYCPVDGKRYSARLSVCPEHGVALKPLDE